MCDACAAWLGYAICTEVLYYIKLQGKRVKKEKSRRPYSVFLWWRSTQLAYCPWCQKSLGGCPATVCTSCQSDTVSTGKKGANGASYHVCVKFLGLSLFRNHGRSRSCFEHAILGPHTADAKILSYRSLHFSSFSLSRCLGEVKNKHRLLAKLMRGNIWNTRRKATHGRRDAMDRRKFVFGGRWPTMSLDEMNWSNGEACLSSEYLLLWCQVKVNLPLWHGGENLTHVSMHGQ